MKIDPIEIKAIDKRKINDKELWLKETYNFLIKTDFDKIKFISDICLDYIMLYEEYDKIKNNEEKRINKRLKDIINVMNKTSVKNMELIRENKRLHHEIDRLLRIIEVYNDINLEDDIVF